ncbi:hypothetical protein [Streptomyces oceani]|uniref:hypothetical protein n=1 Tax=Streptomyces oceani TaxID=1075402 RepID=UPI00147B231A|nr:hypothetical protein [Streptomyces oceani]
MTTQPQPMRADEHGDAQRWDDPMTRLMLLLEIANEPAWLRDVTAAPAEATGSRTPEG